MATKAIEEVHICANPESSLNAASFLPLAEGAVPGAVPAMTVPVNGTEVAPFGAFPDPCPLATRDEYAAAAPVAAKFETDSDDSAALVGAAKTCEEAGGVTGPCCVSVVAYGPPDVPIDINRGRRESARSINLI